MRFVAGAAAFALLASGIGATAQASAATTSPQFTPAPAVWGTCPASYSDLQTPDVQCASITVPLNYSHPNNGQTTTIEISRIQHTSSAADYQGIILTNPGGPGGTGLDLNTFLLPVLKAEGSAADKAAIADYDWIGFDPRGTGASKAIHCNNNYFVGPRRAYDPTTKSLTQYWLKRSKNYAQACGKKSAAQTALLKNDTTVDSARDMDMIRAALGQSQITYYGFSYGTYLGQVYSTLFPTHVRRIIMDSNVDPRNIWYKANLNQDIAFNRNVNIWFAWVAKNWRIYHLGRTEAAVRKTYYAQENRLKTHPIWSGGLKVGPDEWTDVFLETGYYEQTWLQWTKAFADWTHHHNAAAAAEVVNLYGFSDSPGDDNGFADYNAVQCTDIQWPLSYAKWDRDNTRVNKTAPFETWANAWFNAPCLYWPAPASRKTAMKINGKNIKNALLIDETLDAATPFEGSLYVRKIFPHSVLLAEPGGTTHADSLSGNLCVDNTIANYLAFGKLPKRNNHAAWDKTCKPLPRPVPTKSDAATPNMSRASQARMLPAQLLAH
jgi:pimeloyl-ACP methyl ester carboxylesterase